MLVFLHNWPKKNKEEETIGKLVAFELNFQSIMAVVFFDIDHMLAVSYHQHST